MKIFTHHTVNNKKTKIKEKSRRQHICWKCH